MLAFVRFAGSTRPTARIGRRCRTLVSARAVKRRSTIIAPASYGTHASPVTQHGRIRGRRELYASFGGDGAGASTDTDWTRTGLASAAAAAVASASLLAATFDPRRETCRADAVSSGDAVPAASVEVGAAGAGWPCEDKITPRLDGASGGRLGGDEERRSSMDGLLGRYEIGRLLGEGAFGLVFEAKPVGSERRVALKKICKEGVRREEVLREMSTLKAIHAAGGHENIAGVLEVFEDRTGYFFVLELVSGGEMFEHLTRNGPYSEATAAGFMRELAAALRFLHSREMIHGDLKPENLMLSSWDLGESKLKLVDFGSSMRIGTDVDLSKGSLGTACYMPPEALMGRAISEGGGSGSGGGGCATGAGEGEEGGGERLCRGRASEIRAGTSSHLLATPALDMWSVGCILYIMLSGAHPFDLEGNASEAVVLERVRTGEVPLEGLGPGISDSAKDLISRLMTRDPHDRLTAGGMQRHPWIQGRTAPEQPLEGSDARLARFREVLSQQLETGVVSMLVGGAVKGTQGFPGGYSRRSDTTGSSGVTEAVDVVKNAYKAFDRRGTGRVSAQDIAGFLEEHSAQVSEEDQRAINEAVTVKTNCRHPSGKTSPRHEANGNSSQQQQQMEPPPSSGAGTDMNTACGSSTAPSGVIAATSAATPATALTGDASAAVVKTPKPEEMIAAAMIGGRGERAVDTATEAGGGSVLGSGEEGSGLEETGGELKGEEAGLDMADFEELLDHLKTREYSPGDYVFREGDAPDGGLYFIMEGNVDVLVDSAGEGERIFGSGNAGGGVEEARPQRAHTRVASMGPGDFFGEGGVVSAQPRGESVRAATRCKVINVSLASCHRMIDGPGKVSSSLRRVALSRALFRAKNVVRAVNSVKRRHLGVGETVFRQGDAGSSLYTVDEGDLDVVKEHEGVSRTVARLSPGSCFGEMALMTAQPRSASVVCASGGGCAVDEISGDDFAKLLMARRTGFRRDVMRMLRARQFRHGVYKLLTELGSDVAFTDRELRRVFDRADTTKSGNLTLAELKTALCRADPALEETAVREMMAMLDLEAVGSVSFEEFLKVIRWDP